MSNDPNKPGGNPRKILVVEDDELVSETLQTLLRTAGYEVKAAQNGNEASSTIALEDFDLVLSDIRMPVMTGIELLHFIKRTKPVPVVFMTGFSEIADAQEAYELGAAGFLPKPFKKADLIAVMEEVFREAPAEAAPAEEESEFCPIRIDDFTSGHEIRYDIYIQISKHKFIKIASGGTSLDMSQIERFKAKGISHLHLTRGDFHRYLGFNLDLAKRLVAAERVELKKKARFLVQASMETAKNLFVNGIDREGFEAAEEAVVLSVGLIAESPDVFNMLESLKRHTDQLYAHSLAVGIYATMIAKKIGWASPRTAAKVSMCGLFHDIGKKEIDQEILKKPRIRRSPEETKVFESHPARGRELIELANFLPAEVSQVALQHHENCSGIGYPMRLTKNRTQPIARLVGLTNDFCNLIIPNVDQPEPVTPSEALARLQQNAAGYDEEFLEGLKKLIVSPPPPTTAL
jgi:putative nucleotidyltransferase with HDIG domain